MSIDRKLAIRIKISKLAGLEYDHDQAGGLPIRPDVTRHTIADLFPEGGRGVSEALLRQIDDFEVSLHQDGTISVELESGERSLFLDVPCGGVVTYVKAFEDDQTSIEGVIRTGYPTVNDSAVAEIDALIEWLVQE